MNASQVLGVPKTVGFSIPGCEPEPEPLGTENVAPVWVGGPLKTLLLLPPTSIPTPWSTGLLDAEWALLQRRSPRGPLGLSLTTKYFFFSSNVEERPPRPSTHLRLFLQETKIVDFWPRQREMKPPCANHLAFLLNPTASRDWCHSMGSWKSFSPFWGELHNILMKPTGFDPSWITFLRTVLFRKLTRVSIMLTICPKIWCPYLTVTPILICGDTPLLYADVSLLLGVTFQA